jgi:hypothetical protein
MPAEIINLLDRMSNTRSETDALYDTSDRAMAERFGFRAQTLMQGPAADVKQTARLAFSYAQRALDTQCRIEQLVTKGVH